MIIGDRNSSIWDAGESVLSIGFDGTTYRLEVNKADGSLVTARMATGTHTDQEHAALILRLRSSYAALRQWKIDADAAVAAWDGRTVAQNMAVLKVVVQRFGNLADGMADLLASMNADQ